MKRLTLTLCAVAALASTVFAGTESYPGKEMKQTEPAPCPEWYAENEWNIGISGLYAHNVGNDDDNFVFGNEWDDAWGGALDVKYFFRRYWGVGIQGFGMSLDHDDDNRVVFDDDDDWNWGVLGTFTFRYPIPCSRFAPYAWAGLGGYFTDDNRFFNNNDDDNDGRFMGQFGGGLEVRFSQHVGWTNDVSYNDVEGGDDDFIMVRTGLNFAF